MKILLLSDTHSYWDTDLESLCKNYDEVWHAGDIGDIQIIDNIKNITKLRAVYGNIDNHKIRQETKLDEIFNIDGLKFWITHIGGYPPNYTPAIREKIELIKPNIFICGHSHILKIIPDKKREILHMNPGAAGKEGFHKVRTLISFEIKNSQIINLNIIEKN